MASARTIRLHLGAWIQYVRADVQGGSVVEASRLLQENHERYHIFINSGGYHNHVAHLLLTSWALRASSQQLRNAYERNVACLRPRNLGDVAKSTIQSMHDPEKFSTYLGREIYYESFLQYFEAEIESLGWPTVLERYVFANDLRANAMLTRLFSGFLHPIIHLGLGIEFNQPAIIAEGLAQAAIHDDMIKDLLLASEEVAKQQRSLQAPESPSMVQLLHEIRNDEEILRAPKYADTNKIRDGLLARAGNRMIQYLAKVHVSGDEVTRKAAEITNAIAYCTAGAQKSDKVIKFDFYLLHSLNASIVFAAMTKCPLISNTNKARMLEWKIRMDLIMYASRGSPEIRLQEIRDYQPRRPSGWDGIQDRALALADDGHACKSVRAIASGARESEVYGTGADSDAFPLKGDDWLKVGHMAIDSVEAQGEGPESYVRGAGFDEAWSEFAPRAP